MQVDQWTKIVIPLGTPTDEAFLSKLQDTVRQYITKKTRFDGFTFEQLFPNVAFLQDVNDKLCGNKASFSCANNETIVCSTAGTRLAQPNVGDRSRQAHKR